jgi:acyl-CoA synthetase (AMP-forming)/AMP-acid ligase II
VPRIAEGPLTVPALLAERAAMDPERAALLTEDGRSLTFREWEVRSNAVAAGLLARGTCPGDRVGLLFGDDEWIDFAVAYCGVQRAGAVAVPLPPRLALAELRDLLGRCAASGVVHGCDVGPPPTGPWTAALRALERGGCGRDPFAVEVRPGDLAQILYTSGTTGTPKGVCATHGNLTHGLGGRLRQRPLAHSELFLHAFPIGTNAGQTMLLNALVARPAALVQARFDAERFCELIEARRVGTVFVVPAMAIALLNAGAPGRRDVSSVLLLGSTAAALPPAIATALAAAFPNATIVNYYTSTEAAPAQTTMVFDPERPASVGRTARAGELLVAGARGEVLRAGEVGEIRLRSPAAPRAYYGDPRASAEVFVDGWVRMGDTGYLDEDGYLHLVDRETDAIETGAFKVSTLQVEAALHEHPAVAEAAVFGVPHPVMGAMVAAAVVLRSPAALAGVRAFLRERLARHEQPVRIAVVDSLPRNDAGKVLKRELRARLAAPASSSGRPPSAPVEVALGELWARVLGVPAVSAGDDFFALGGDSLAATRLAALAGEAFGAGVPTSLAFDVPVLADQAEWIESARTAASAAPLRTATAPAGGVVLSAQQESFLAWMRESSRPRDCGNIGVAIRIRDEFDPALLERSLAEVVRRHEALRTIFATRDGGTGAVVLPELPPEVAVTPAASEEEAGRLAGDARFRSFDLARGPLVRALAVRLAPEDHVLVLVVHHMVFDGASMGVLIRELSLLYSAYRAGLPSPLPPLPMQCSDLFAWARRQWPSTREFWRRALDGAPAAIDPFPGRTRVDRFTRASIPFHAGRDLAAGLRATARASAGTAYMAVAACWTAVLASWSGTTDVVVMSPVSGRTRPGAESLIGCLVQSLLPRLDAGGDPTFGELLERVRATTLAALDHQLYPYEEFRVRFRHAAWIRYERWGRDAHFPGLESEPFDLPHDLVDEDWEIPGGDLTVPELNVVEQPDGSLSGWVTYNRFAFERPTAERLAADFLRCAERAVAAPDRRLTELSR